MTHEADSTSNEQPVKLRVRQCHSPEPMGKNVTAEDVVEDHVVSIESSDHESRESIGLESRERTDHESREDTDHEPREDTVVTRHKTVADDNKSG